ncbi:MAG: hypothetical protein WBF13_11235 [Candidatus Zixiibacteriota bacterium]
MFTYCRVTLAAILVLPLIINCSKSTRTECTPRTPKADEEAELIALCLSGELVAPDGLYEQVRRDLATIRATFGDTIELIDQIRFSPPWSPGFLMIGFDVTAVEQIRSGQYHAWDELNEKYEVMTIDTMLLDWIGLATLSFKGRLHGHRLAELYGVLPGTWTVNPSYSRGDLPNVYCRQTWEGMTYLFRYGWGDCPSGCIYSEFWYFRVDDNLPAFVGHWAPHQEPNVPEWWEEARLNREHYCD